MRFLRKLFNRIVCKVKGCDYGPVVYCSPSVLQFCKRCGSEIQGRTFEDLEPMTEEDRDFLDSLTDWEND